MVNQPIHTSTIAEIMTKPVATVTPSDSILHAVSVMVDKEIGCVVVLQGKPVGILTERDILKQIRKGIDFMHVPVKEVMSKPVVTIASTDDPLKALSMMTDRKIRRLPVVEREKLVGIVTERDLVRWILIHPEVIATLLSESSFPVLSKELIVAFFTNIGPERGLR